MRQGISEKSRKYIDMFLELPPDYGAIESVFAEFPPTPDELADIAAEVTDASCLCYKTEDNPGNYLYSTIKFLLKRGLDPNKCGYNGAAMRMLSFVVNPGVAGNVMRLLIDNGGLVNYSDDEKEASLYESLLEDLWNEADAGGHWSRELFDCWIVCAAYGGKCRSSNKTIKMMIDADVSIFKDFYKYDYSFSYNPFKDVMDGKPWLEIYDKASHELVAVYL